MFPKSTRLGFVSQSKKIETPYPTLPLYVQWGSGEPYRFQSFYQFGGVAPNVLPSVEPQGVIRSDLKSHLFHGSFIGNIAALPAGTEYFSSNASGFLPISEKQLDKTLISISLNYLALMGVDWGPWSLSVGNYYPLHLIQIKDQFREVLATASSPLFRLMYTTKSLRFRGVFSSVNYGTSGGADDSQLSISNTQSVVGVIDGFDLKNTMFRFGLDWSSTKIFLFLWIKLFFKENTQKIPFQRCKTLWILII